jgi:hypothetical protein
MDHGIALALWIGLGLLGTEVFGAWAIGKDRERGDR